MYATVLLCFIALVTKGEAIKCYNCNLQDNQNCRDPKAANMPLKDCSRGYEPRAQRTREANSSRIADIENISEIDTLNTNRRTVNSPFCAKVVAIDRFGDEILRGCPQYFKPSNLQADTFCAVMKHQISNIPGARFVSCSTCMKDACNASGTSSLSLFLIIAFITQIIMIT